MDQEPGLFGGGERGGSPTDRVYDQSLDIELEEEEEAEWDEDRDKEEAVEGSDGTDPSSTRLRGYSYHGAKYGVSPHHKGNYDGNSYHGGHSFGSSHGSSYYNENSHHGDTRGGSFNHKGNSYHKHWNKGCRTFHGDKGSSYNDYDLYDYVDKHFCKHKCDSLGDYCHGYEYSNSGRCEVWKSPIHEVGYSYGRDCYKKSRSI